MTTEQGVLAIAACVLDLYLYLLVVGLVLLILIGTPSRRFLSMGNPSQTTHPHACSYCPLTCAVGLDS